uniref:Uncharacterized protein n=1 Tax=Romanomermis culicivorax TaxID=13658 RepID=A0A915IU40_ROMCU
GLIFIDSSGNASTRRAIPVSSNPYTSVGQQNQTQVQQQQQQHHPHAGSFAPVLESSVTVTAAPPTLSSSATVAAPSNNNLNNVPDNHPSAATASLNVGSSSTNNTNNSQSNLGSIAASAAAAAAASASTLSTSSLLARLFGVLVRNLTDLLNTAYDYQRMGPSLSRTVPFSKEDAIELQALIDQYLKPSWGWLKIVLDSTESQLKFGSALVGTKLSQIDEKTLNAVMGTPLDVGPSTSGSFYSHSSSFARVLSGIQLRDEFPGGSSTTSGFSTSSETAPPTGKRSSSSKQSAAENLETLNTSNRRDFLNYALSLMRGHSDEHGDDLPAIELTSLRHVAYVLDAMLYYLNNATPPTQQQYRSATSTPSAMSAKHPSGGANYGRSGYDYRSSDLENSLDSFPGAGNKSPSVERSNTARQEEQLDETVAIDQKHLFFKRSDSMTYPGLYPLKPPHEYSVHDSLPLVERPDLLQTEATTETYFGVKNLPQTFKRHQALAKDRGQNFAMHIGLSTGVLSVDKEMKTPVNISLSSEINTVSIVAEKSNVEKLETPTSSSGPAISTDLTTPTKVQPRIQSVIVHTSSIQRQKSSTLLFTRTPEEKERLDQLFTKFSEGPAQAQIYMSRWRLALNIMARAFSDDVGQEPGSILVQLAGFSVKAARFRRDMERLRSPQQGKDLSLEVDRNRNLLIQATIRQLNQFFGRRPSNYSGPPVTVYKVKVKFKDEPGEGLGVARAFYTAVAEAFLSQEKLPNLEGCQPTSYTPTPTSSNKMQQQRNYRQNPQKVAFTASDRPIGNFRPRANADASAKIH